MVVPYKTEAFTASFVTDLLAHTVTIKMAFHGMENLTHRRSNDIAQRPTSDPGLDHMKSKVESSEAVAKIN